MNKNQVAWIWATAILATTFAVALGVLDERVAKVSYLVILTVAVIHIARAPCAVSR
jgi:hypothetical protein